VILFVSLSVRTIFSVCKKAFVCFFVGVNSFVCSSIFLMLPSLHLFIGIFLSIPLSVEIVLFVLVMEQICLYLYLSEQLCLCLSLFECYNLFLCLLECIHMFFCLFLVIICLSVLLSVRMLLCIGASIQQMPFGMLMSVPLSCPRVPSVSLSFQMLFCLFHSVFEPSCLFFCLFVFFLCLSKHCGLFFHAHLSFSSV
jgi:hypothetical protein